MNLNFENRPFGDDFAANVMSRTHQHALMRLEEFTVSEPAVTSRETLDDLTHEVGAALGILAEIHRNIDLDPRVAVMEILPPRDENQLRLEVTDGNVVNLYLLHKRSVLRIVNTIEEALRLGGGLQITGIPRYGLLSSGGEFVRVRSYNGSTDSNSYTPFLGTPDVINSKRFAIQMQSASGIVVAGVNRAVRKDILSRGR